MSSLLPRRLYPIAIFTALYLIGSGIVAWYTSNEEFLVYLALLLTLTPLILIVHRRVNLPLPLLWMFSIWGILHMLGGMLHLSSIDSVLYNLWLYEPYLKYDQLIHAFGFGISTWAGWLCLRSFQPSLQPTAGPLIVSMLIGLGLGALNETVEFFATLTLEETNVGSYTNVGWDLVFNLIGALIAITWIRLHYGKER